jgi:competence protein ComEA
MVTYLSRGGIIMDFTGERSRAFLLLAVIIAVLGGYMLYSIEREPAKEPQAPPPSDQPENMQREKGKGVKNEEALIVYVCGAVKEPGVYRLPAGSIKVRAIEAAGGAADSADMEKINLASSLKAGEMIRVPSRITARSSGGAPGRQDEADRASAPEVSESAFPVNINTAGADALDRLPGIGPATARKIVEYRDLHGPFQDIEELKNIRGMKKKAFERIKDKISLQ